MRLMVTLDSRHRNAGGFLFLDLGRGHSHYYAHTFAEPFRRLGFRGGSFLQSACPDPERRQIAVCNAAAVYRFDLYWPRGGAPEVHWVHTEHRPEWALGERAAADLHHVHHCPRRQRLLVANSFMDCVDFLDEDGRFRERCYLWDLAPEFRTLAAGRKPQAADLCHLNHISSLGDAIVLTLGNLNGSRTGAVITLDEGRFLLRDLAFPHDGLRLGDDFFLSLSGASQVACYPGIASAADLATASARIIALRPPAERPEWADSPQWVRGICATDRHLVVGISQFRDVFNTTTASHAPPRLAVLDRASGRPLGTLYLPPHPLLERPALFSLLMLDDEGVESPDFRAWPLTDEEQPLRVAPVRAVSQALERIPQAGLDATWFWSGDETLAWSEPVDPALPGRGIRLEADLPHGERAILATGNRGSLDIPPDDPVLWRLYGDSETHLRLDIASRDPFLELKVQVLEYDDQRRIRQATHVLGEGKREITWRSAPATRSCRIALHLSGRGRAVITGLRLAQQVPADRMRTASQRPTAPTATAPAASAPAAASTVAADPAPAPAPAPAASRAVPAEVAALRQQLAAATRGWQQEQAAAQAARDALDRLQNSRSLRLGQALGQAVTSPAAALQLPGRLWRLWRGPEPR